MREWIDLFDAFAILLICLLWFLEKHFFSFSFICWSFWKLLSAKLDITVTVCLSNIIIPVLNLLNLSVLCYSIWKARSKNIPLWPLFYHFYVSTWQAGYEYKFSYMATREVILYNTLRIILENIFWFFTHSTSSPWHFLGCWNIGTWTGKATNWYGDEMWWLSPRGRVRSKSWLWECISNVAVFSILALCCSVDLQARRKSTHVNELNDCWLLVRCLLPCSSNLPGAT